MYQEILAGLETQLKKVNSQPVQVGFYGDVGEVNLAKAAILLEPLVEQRSSKSMRWRGAEFKVRLWLLVEIVRSYMSSLSELQDIIAADDKEEQKIGIHAALDQLKRDDSFRSLTGSVGGKTWRIGPEVIEYSATRFGINLGRSSTKINTAQIDVVIHIEVEQ